jgi:hypothetical protein
MATHTHNQEILHDHAGARWLVPMLAVMAVVVIGFYLMLGYGYR